jgi:TPP-dependent pyruvate/acetoin dehydrogenase alpha subunit
MLQHGGKLIPAPNAQGACAAQSDAMLSCRDKQYVFPTYRQVCDATLGKGCAEDKTPRCSKNRYRAHPQTGNFPASGWKPD